MQTVKFSDGTTVPSLGQGTWRMGERWFRRRKEIASLRLGIELGLTCIDTAESYGDGAAEEVVGEAIADLRDSVFLVSKVSAFHATRDALPASCEASLRRLRVETLDLYLLHWRGEVPLEETVEAMGRLRAQGKIRRWGVSNFDVADLEALGAAKCSANQVLYHPQARGIEFDLLPWCQAHDLPLMIYSPLGQAGKLLREKTLLTIAHEHGVTAAQIALAWGLRQPGVISIPKAAHPGHVRANAAARDLQLRAEDLARIDAALPPPNEKQPLVIW